MIIINPSYNVIILWSFLNQYNNNNDKGVFPWYYDRRYHISVPNTNQQYLVFGRRSMWRHVQCPHRYLRHWFQYHGKHAILMFTYIRTQFRKIVIIFCWKWIQKQETNLVRFGYSSNICTYDCDWKYFRDHIQLDISSDVYSYSIWIVYTSFLYYAYKKGYISVQLGRSEQLLYRLAQPHPIS